MSTSNPDFAAILSDYADDCRPRQTLAVDSGGFSGSRIWQLDTARGLLCLKRWPPEYPDAERLQFIHSVLAKVDAAGFRKIALPIADLRGATIVEFDDHRWELTRWLPGEADQADRPQLSSSPSRIEAAATALAEFHQAATHGNRTQPFAAAPGILTRTAQVKGLLAGELDGLSLHIERNKLSWPKLAMLSQPLLERVRTAAPQVYSEMADLAEVKVPIQPCIRDIHRDHVLFTGDSVTGIIDFGAMKLDSVAGDLARLLGSMAIDDESLWHTGLAAYEVVRSLSKDETRLIRAYDRSAVLLSGLHWLRWIFAEDRRFPHRDSILQRFAVISQRLSRL